MLEKRPSTVAIYVLRDSKEYSASVSHFAKKACDFRMDELPNANLHCGCVTGKVRKHLHIEVRINYPLNMIGAMVSALRGPHVDRLTVAHVTAQNGKWAWLSWKPILSFLIRGQISCYTYSISFIHSTVDFLLDWFCWPRVFCFFLCKVYACFIILQWRERKSSQPLCWMNIEQMPRRGISKKTTYRTIRTISQIPSKYLADLPSYLKHSLYWRSPSCPYYRPLYLVFSMLQTQHRRQSSILQHT